METEMRMFFEAFEGRLNGRFDRIEQRLDRVEQRLDEHDHRFDRLERNQHDLQEQVAFLIDRFGKFADDMTKRVQSHEFRLTSLEARVALG